MRKNLLTALISILFLVSCGGGTSTENKGAENVDSKTEASQIISYTNALIDYLNGSGDWMRSNESRISDMMNYMRSGRKPTIIMSMSPNISFNMRSKDKDLTNPPSVMSEEEQSYFRDNMSAYKKTYESMIEKCETLYKYIKNEDFKDDNFAKGKAFADSIEIQYNFLTETKSDLYNKIDVVTEKAEAIVLADDPLRDPILTLKSEMKEFENLSNLFAEYNEGKATVEQVDAAYQLLAGKVEENKNKYTDLLTERNKKSNYDSFYSRCEDALAEYRKALREIKANKKLKDRAFNTFNSEYNRMVKSYNSFVN